MKKAAFCTLGCRVNQYESVSLAESLIGMGYTIVPASEKADIYIVNTCAVTAESARKSAQLARKMARKGGRVAVLGCASQLKPEVFSDIDGVFFVTGNGRKHELIDLLTDEVMPKEIRVTDVPKTFEDLKVGFKSTELFSSCRAYIKIQDGCNCRCSYCTIPFARGASRSRPLSDIIAEAERLASLGYSELELTGIETGAYSDAPLSELITRISGIDGIKRIRLGSLSPNCITDDFVSAVKTNEKFMPHLHISVQTGSGRILRAMRRPYTFEKMDEKLALIKKELPDFQISVDIICGFPTETEENFEETLQLVKKYRFSHVHGFAYSEREGTVAAQMEGSVPINIRRARNERLIALSDAIHAEILDEHIGKNDTVLVETIKNGVCNGHTSDYLELNVPALPGDRVGDYIEVNIISNDGNVMCGERIS